MSNATISDGTVSISTATATTTITDNDQAIDFAIASTASIDEDAQETTTFTVTLDSALNAGNTATVDIAQSGTATDGTDYDTFMTAVSNAAAATAGVSLAGSTLTFDDTYDETTAFTFTMDAIDDNIADSGETIIGTLSNATVSNGTATISTATATTTITDNEPVDPTISPDQESRVSEEGLANGIADTIGESGSTPDPTDTTNLTVSTGQFTVADGNPTDTLSVTLSVPVGNYTSNGEAISWSVNEIANISTLVGEITTGDNPRDIIKVEMDDAGAYTTTLLGAIDHDAPPANTAVENELTLALEVTVDDGTGRTDSSTLNVIIEDDSPVATPQVVDLVFTPPTTNLTFIIDISSSMSDQDLAYAEDAIAALVDGYDDVGNVQVKIVQFYGNGNHDTGWISGTDAKNISLDTTRGGTDIEQGLHQMVDTYTSGTYSAADQDVMYFFGDGNTYDAYQTDFDAYTGIPGNRDNGDAITNVDYNNTWTNFITGGQIDKFYTYSVNTNNVLVDIAHVADNNEDTISAPAINVDDISQLDTYVSDTIGLYDVGNMLEDTANGTTYIEYGADGGHIESVTINNNTVLYDPNNVTQEVAGSYGTFSINFETGDYNYHATGYIDHTEEINVSIQDNDGDTVNAVLVTLNINYNGTFPDNAAAAPDLTMAIQDNGTPTTITWEDTTDYAFRNSGDTHTYNIGASATSAEIRIDNYRDNSDEGTITFIENGLVVGTVSLDDATTGGNDENHIFTVNPGVTFDSVKIESTNDHNFQILNFSTDVSAYSYQIDLTATLNDTDGSESLTELLLRDLPSDVVLVEDQNGNPVLPNATGEYVVDAAPSSGVQQSVTIYTASEMTTAEVAAVASRVTSLESNGNNTTTVEVHEGQNAVIIDGIIEGLYYETSSGLTGYTESDGSFDFADGDVVSFMIGNVQVGEIDTTNIVDGKVFLQDLAGVERTDMNDEYLENMAVLLQSLDSDSSDNIVISEAMHEAFSDESFDLGSLSEEELAAIIEENGAEAVSEEAAMAHVGEMLEAYDGVEEGTLDVHTSDLLSADSFDFSDLVNDTVQDMEVIDLSQDGDHSITGVTAQDVLDITDDSNTLTIMGDSEDSVSLVDGAGAWQTTGTSTIDGHTYNVYHNNEDASMTLYVETAIQATVI